MKFLKTTVTAILLTGSIAGGALAADGVLSKDEVTPGSYCHMKFPAIRETTLFSDHPQLKSSTSGDVIDFYGACDESYGHGPSDLAEARRGVPLRKRLRRRRLKFRAPEHIARRRQPLLATIL